MPQARILDQFSLNLDRTFDSGRRPSQVFTIPQTFQLFLFPEQVQHVHGVIRQLPQIILQPACCPRPSALFDQAAGRDVCILQADKRGFPGLQADALRFGVTHEQSYFSAWQRPRSPLMLSLIPLILSLLGLA